MKSFNSIATLFAVLSAAVAISATALHKVKRDEGFKLYSATIATDCISAKMWGPNGERLLWIRDGNCDKAGGKWRTDYLHPGTLTAFEAGGDYAIEAVNPKAEDSEVVLSQTIKDVEGQKWTFREDGRIALNNGNSCLSFVYDQAFTVNATNGLRLQTRKCATVKENPTRQIQQVWKKVW